MIGLNGVGCWGVWDFHFFDEVSPWKEELLAVKAASDRWFTCGEEEETRIILSLICGNSRAVRSANVSIDNHS